MVVIGITEAQILAPPEIILVTQFFPIVSPKRRIIDDSVLGSETSTPKRGTDIASSYAISTRRNLAAESISDKEVMWVGI